MGRGLGNVQRQVLAALGDESPSGHSDWTIAELVCAIFGARYGDSERRSVARAVTTMDARGLVTTHLSARRFCTAEHPKPAFLIPELVDDDGTVWPAREARSAYVQPLPVPESAPNWHLRRIECSGSDYRAVNEWRVVLRYRGR